MKTVMKNRYGDEYAYVPVDENTYQITGALKYWRFGGKEGQSDIDMNDLGMCDPSGGPFLSIGQQLFGRRITRIRASGDLDGQPEVFIELGK